MKLQYPRSFPDENVKYGARFYHTADGNFHIIVREEGWFLQPKTQAYAQHKALCQTLREEGFYDTPFPTRRALIAALEAFIAAEA